MRCVANDGNKLQLSCVQCVHRVLDLERPCIAPALAAHNSRPRADPLPNVKTGHISGEKEGASQCIHSVKLKSSGEKWASWASTDRPPRREGRDRLGHVPHCSTEFPQGMFSLSSGKEKAAHVKCKSWMMVIANNDLDGFKRKRCFFWRPSHSWDRWRSTCTNATPPSSHCRHCLLHSVRDARSRVSARHCSFEGGSMYSRH